MTGAAVRIRLDVAACVGHGRCYALDPATFLPDDLGHCELAVDVVDGEGAERARRAVAACPEGALTIED